VAGPSGYSVLVTTILGMSTSFFLTRRALLNLAV
jgi:hypothetical protein